MTHATHAAAAGPDAPHGPGWFDSSWELSRGCDVQEGWPADIGLGTWLDRFLQLAAQEAEGCRRALTACPSSSTAIA